MALNVFTQFAPRGLKVAYRAAAERQKLVVSFALDTEFGSGDGAIAAELFTRIVNEGGAGADLFAPTAGRAKQLKGDRYPDHITRGPEWTFEFEVAGVAPSFVRTLVESFARAGGGVNRLTRLEITGSLPVDGTELSVDTKRALGWLNDPLAYPAAWPTPPFAVKDKACARGASIRLTPAEAPSEALQKQLFGFCQGWGELVTGTMRGADGGFGTMQVSPKMSQTKKQVRAALNSFTYTPRPARDALLNLLVGFHHRVAPLTEVELAFPASPPQDR